MILVQLKVCIKDFQKYWSPIVVYFYCCDEKYPNKKQLRREKNLLQLIFPWYSLLLLESQRNNFS